MAGPLGFVARSMFFDSAKVRRATDRATRKVLSKFGAYVRTAAKSSIRTRRATSRPGQPPSSHVGLLKKFIWFGYDTNRRSVVIGPMRLNAKLGDAPAALEHGGWSRITSGGRRNKRTVRRAKIEQRPFMGPAMQKELPKLPDMWRDAVK